jgi:hypothetical protein
MSILMGVTQSNPRAPSGDTPYRVDPRVCGCATLSQGRSPDLSDATAPGPAVRTAHPKRLLRLSFVAPLKANDNRGTK